MFTIIILVFLYFWANCSIWTKALFLFSVLLSRSFVPPLTTIMSFFPKHLKFRFLRVHYLLDIGPRFDETRNHKVSIKILINFSRRPFKMTITNYMRIVRIITNAGVRESCREAFKNTEILTLYSQYLFSRILFTVTHKHLFTSNRKIHKYITRNNTNLHLPTVNITKFYKGPYISGSKAFNHLPRHIKILVNDMKTSNYLSTDFYIIILFIQLKNTSNIMRTGTCKSYYMVNLFILLFYAIF